MKTLKIYQVGGRIFVFICLLLLTFYGIRAFGEIDTTSDSEQIVSVNQTDNPDLEPTVAIIKRHISNLNNRPAVHLNQTDKEKYIVIVMCLNYLIVFSVSLLIILKTREGKQEAKELGLNLPVVGHID